MSGKSKIIISRKITQQGCQVYSQDQISSKGFVVALVYWQFTAHNSPRTVHRAQFTAQISPRKMTDI
jgi:hypothetical protein